jgi:prolyl oligopeptidase
VPQAHFPAPLLMTSTTDDVVHPAMTRKYAAKMEALKMPFLYYESSEGGHGISATPKELAVRDALMYSYLADRLMGPHRIEQQLAAYH